MAGFQGSQGGGGGGGYAQAIPMILQGVGNIIAAQQQAKAAKEQRRAIQRGLRGSGSDAELRAAGISTPFEEGAKRVYLIPLNTGAPRGYSYGMPSGGKFPGGMGQQQGGGLPDIFGGGQQQGGGQYPTQDSRVPQQNDMLSMILPLLLNKQGGGVAGGGGPRTSSLTPPSHVGYDAGGNPMSMIDQQPSNMWY